MGRSLIQICDSWICLPLKIVEFCPLCGEICSLSDKVSSTRSHIENCLYNINDGDVIEQENENIGICQEKSNCQTCKLFQHNLNTPEEIRQVEDGKEKQRKDKLEEINVNIKEEETKKDIQPKNKKFCDICVKYFKTNYQLKTHKLQIQNKMANSETEKATVASETQLEEKSNIIAKLSSAVNGNENSMIKVEETVLLVCEGRCISISKEILTAYSTLYAAKLSDRWKEADAQGCGKFHLEEVNDFSWISVYVLIESIIASANEYKMPYGDWMKDDVNLIVEIIQLCDYIGCAALQPEFVKQLDLQKDDMNIKNVTQLFAASKNLISIVDLKGKCEEIKVDCIKFMEATLKSNKGCIIQQQWILDNKDNMDLVLELLEETQIQ